MRFSEPTIKVLKIIQKTNPELLSVEEISILENEAGAETNSLYSLPQQDPAIKQKRGANQ